LKPFTHPQISGASQLSGRQIFLQVDLYQRDIGHGVKADDFGIVPGFIFKDNGNIVGIAKDRI